MLVGFSERNYIAPMAVRQKDLFEYFEMKDTKKRYARTTHGGAATKGRRKQERPLDTKKWIHLVLKSEKAVNELSFLAPKNQLYVDATLKQKAKRFGVRIAEMVNVGNHLHLKIKIASRKAFQSFLRSITTLIARFITGAKRGKTFERFWQGLAFTRVLRTSLEELRLRGYLEANRREAAHCHEAREEYLEQFNKWIKRQRSRGRRGSCPA